MKWMHIGDLHIGKFVHEFSMLKDQEYILNQMIEIAEREQVDGILIAGDIYDRSIPPAEAVSVFNSFLTELIKKERIVCMISGNHDSPERIGFAEKIVEKSNLFISVSAKDGLKKITCKDMYGDINIYFLPFAKPAVMKYWTQEKEEVGEKEEIIGKFDNNYEDLVKKLIEKSDINDNERNILISHYFVIKGKDVPKVSDSEVELNVGGILQMNGDLFDMFDYVALGHLHRAQKVGRDTMRYCGSPLKYSFSEAKYDKSVTIFELKEKGKLLVEQIPLKPIHDMRIIKGRLKDLLNIKVVQAADCNDYIQAILTDEEALYEPMEKLRTVYPNIMQMVKEKDMLRDNLEKYDITALEKKDSFQLYKEFFETVTDDKLVDKKASLIRNIINEVSEEMQNI